MIFHKLYKYLKKWEIFHFQSKWFEFEIIKSKTQMILQFYLKNVKWVLQRPKELTLKLWVFIIMMERWMNFKKRLLEKYLFMFKSTWKSITYLPMILITKILIINEQLKLKFSKFLLKNDMQVILKMNWFDEILSLILKGFFKKKKRKCINHQKMISMQVQLLRK